MGGGAARLGFAIAGLLSAGAAYAADASLEYTVKGAYLYKFIPFIDWPATAFATPASPVTICLFGGDPFGVALDHAVAGQTIAARPIAVRRIATLDGVDQCQEIFVSGSDSQAASAILHAVEGKPILTVTDSNLPSSEQGIIGFVIDANHVRFDVDDAGAAKDGLVVSSKLLALAHAVKPRKAAP